MPAETLTYLPRTLVKGDSYTFLSPDPSFPSSDWSIKLAISTAAPVVIDGAADHTITIDGDALDAATPGIYAIFYLFTLIADASVRRSVSIGSIQLLGDPTAAPVLSWAEQTLATVQTAITQLAARTNAEVTINNEVYRVQDIEKLTTLRDRLIHEVSIEQRRRGMNPVRGGSKTIRTRFVNR